MDCKGGGGKSPERHLAKNTAENRHQRLHCAENTNPREANAVRGSAEPSTRLPKKLQLAKNLKRKGERMC